MRNILPDNEMRALSVAMAGGAVVAVATMFVPAGVFETIAGSTGVSEMVGVAKPPLGDTARALIAFGSGALTLAALVFLLLRQGQPAHDAGDGESDQSPSALRSLFAKIAMPKMPWVRQADDITELEDLPKLKNSDSHPDAPPRHPLRAHELSGADESENWAVQPTMQMPAMTVSDEADRETSGAPNDLSIAEPITEPAIEPAPVQEPTVAADFKPSLAEMVAQLEAAVAERKKQLANLEIVAAQLGAGRSSKQQAIGPSIKAQSSGNFMPQRRAMPVPAGHDGMDDALSSALATLHRINEGVR